MATKNSYKEIILPNKLKILLYQMDSVLSAHAVLFVRAGAVYEKGEERGISHFTEHMGFLGTRKHISSLAISQEGQKIGAQYNAWTNKTNTRYWVGLPYTNIKEGLDFLHQLTIDSLIREDQIEKEKGVILSEFNDFWHNPNRKFYHESWRKRFKTKEHPYSYRPLGIPETIKAIEKEDIISWRKKYYNPANMILSLAGNIKEKILLESIKDNFAKIDEGIKRKEPKFSTKDYSSFSLYHQKEDRPQITFSISFPLFGWKEIERIKNLETAFLNDIFGLGFSSRLFQRIREKERLVYRISSYINLNAWMGAFIIEGSVPIEKLIPAMQAIREEIDKLVKNGVTDKEINLSRNYINSSTLMKFDDPETIVYFFGDQVFKDKKVWYPETYIEKVKKIKKAELNELAKNIFDYSKTNISLMGKITNKTLEEVKDIFKH